MNLSKLHPSYLLTKTLAKLMSLLGGYETPARSRPLSAARESDSDRQLAKVFLMFRNHAEDDLCQK
jgi:hypothetical protein